MKKTEGSMSTTQVLDQWVTCDAPLAIPEPPIAIGLARDTADGPTPQIIPDDGQVNDGISMTRNLATTGGFIV